MKLITQQLLNDLLGKAGSSPRLRTHYNVHESASDPVQRYFVATRFDSYFRPHRHPLRGEFALVLQGLCDVLIFDNTGVVIQRVSIGQGAETVAFDLTPNTWHTWITQSDTSLFFETKQGPYNPDTAVEFASWSPDEGSPEVKAFTARLRNAHVGDSLV